MDEVGVRLPVGPQNKNEATTGLVFIYEVMRGESNAGPMPRKLAGPGGGG